MPTPTGPISFANIRSEFGGATPDSLSEYLRGGANVPVGQPVSTTDGNVIEWRSGQPIRVGTFRNLTKTASGASWVSNTGLSSTAWGTSRIPNAIAWNGSVFCTVGQTGGCATSPNGTTWTYRTGLSTAVSTTATWEGICWTGSTFVAVGTDGSTGVCATSADGITWTSRPINAAMTGPRAVAANGSSVVAVGFNGSSPRIAYSTNSGASWTASTISSLNSSTGGFSSVTWNGSVWCAVGGGNLGVFSARATGNGANFTGDGSPGALKTAWTSATFSGNASASAITSAGSLLIAAGSVNVTSPPGAQRAIAATSSDGGVSWTWQTGLFALYVIPTDIVASPSAVVMTGNLWASLAAAGDAVTWVAPSPQMPILSTAIAWNGSIFCAVGSNGTCATSV